MELALQLFLHKTRFSQIYCLNEVSKHTFFDTVDLDVSTFTRNVLFFVLKIEYAKLCSGFLRDHFQF